MLAASDEVCPWSCSNVCIAQWPPRHQGPLVSLRYLQTVQRNCTVHEVQLGGLHLCLNWFNLQFMRQSRHSPMGWSPTFSLVRYSWQKRLFRKVTHQIEWALSTGATGTSELLTFVLPMPKLRIISRKFAMAFCPTDLVVFGWNQQPLALHCHLILHGHRSIPCCLD